MRQAGVLLHISSLPGPGGLGSLGKEAYAFADFLHEAGMKIWQVLPMGPVGYGESPYQSTSVYAGNPMLISCPALRDEGLLDFTDDEMIIPPSEEWADFERMRENREMLLRRAFVQSEEKLTEELKAFTEKEHWVEDYALFIAIKRSFGNILWTRWPDESIRLRKPESVAWYRQSLDTEVRYHIFCQYLFAKQWYAFKEYCNKLDIKLFGDMPIYCAEDSADNWTRPEVFQLDENRIPLRIAGVPPDYFCEDGQLWGNPLYRWERLRMHGYDWWVDRMSHMARMYDLIRIDHFIGFANYYSVAHGAPNARNGKWVVGPGTHLFDVLKEKVPDAHIIAEDLGVQNDRVKNLLAYVKYPGMRVLEFGFGGDDENRDLPHHYVENCVAYTGTHDNDTIRGFVDQAKPAVLAHVRKYLKIETNEEAAPAFINAVMNSAADTAVIPMQDILGLGTECRMNTPGTLGGNWAWRMKPGAASPEVAARLKKLVTDTKRG